MSHGAAVDLPKMRTRDDMAVARVRGKPRGKPSKLTTRQQAHLVHLHAAGEHTIARPRRDVLRQPSHRLPHRRTHDHRQITEQITDNYPSSLSRFLSTS